MQDRYYIIWKHLNNVQRVEISEFFTQEEASAFIRLIATFPDLRVFIAMIKGVKLISKEQMLI